MLYLTNLITLEPSASDPHSAAAVLNRVAGHYRMDRLNQLVIEDLRQRLARSGVSLLEFRGTYLPLLRSALARGVALGSPKNSPVLFDYRLPPLPFNEAYSPWMEQFAANHQAETARRYQRIIEMYLLSYFQDADLRALDKAALDAYRAYFLDRGWSASSFRLHSQILYGIIDFHVGQALDACGMAAPPKAPSFLLKDTAQRWLASLEEKSESQAIAHIRSQLDTYILPILGLSDLRKFNQRRIRDYRAALARRGAGTAVLQEHVEILNQILQYAVQNGLLKFAPHLSTPLNPAGITPENRPDSARLSRVIHADTHLADVLAIRLAWQLGLRQDEIRLLRWSDLELDAAVAHINGRVIPICTDLLSYLIPRAGKPDHYVIFTAHSKQIQPISLPYLYRLCRDLLARFGLDGVTLTDLRNDYIVHLLESGYSPEEAATLCGISDVAAFCRRFVNFLPSGEA